jgi:hypothetical protein
MEALGTLVASLPAGFLFGRDPAMARSRIPEHIDFYLAAAVLLPR